MFELRKSFTFEASHQLVHHDGKCQNLHGHSYTLVVELQSATLVGHGPKRNMVADFSDVSAVVRRLIKSHLDHHHLNETLGTDSPTAEYIAQFCFHQLKPDIPFLVAVEVRETPTSSIVYRPREVDAPHAGDAVNGVANGAGVAAVRVPMQTDSGRCSTCPHCVKRPQNGTGAKAFANGSAKNQLLKPQAPLRRDHDDEKVANMNGT